MTETPVPTDTAHATWGRRWATAEGRADWLTPEPDVVAMLPHLVARGALRVLDLGCGVGRHALLFARHGFAVTGADASADGVDFASAEARAEALPIEYRVAPMTALPFDDRAFDYVLAWNVIYHGDPPVVAAALGEIARVLAPRGLFQGTMLSTRHAKYGLGRMIATDTFVIDAEEEKAHPHFYCDSDGLARLLAPRFALVSAVEREHRGEATWHIHFLAERLPAAP